jgi:hypothetical protein
MSNEKVAKVRQEDLTRPRQNGESRQLIYPQPRAAGGSMMVIYIQRHRCGPRSQKPSSELNNETRLFCSVAKCGPAQKQRAMGNDSGGVVVLPPWGACGSQRQIAPAILGLWLPSIPQSALDKAFLEESGLLLRKLKRI